MICSFNRWHCKLHSNKSFQMREWVSGLTSHFIGHIGDRSSVLCLELNYVWTVTSLWLWGRGVNIYDIILEGNLGHCDLMWQDGEWLIFTLKLCDTIYGQPKTHPIKARLTMTCIARGGGLLVEQLRYRNSVCQLLNQDRYWKYN